MRPGDVLHAKHRYKPRGRRSVPTAKEARAQHEAERERAREIARNSRAIDEQSLRLDDATEALLRKIREDAQR